MATPRCAWLGVRGMAAAARLDLTASHAVASALAAVSVAEQPDAA